MRKTNLLGATALNTLVLLGASFAFTGVAAAQTAGTPAQTQCDDGSTVPAGEQCPAPAAPTTSAEVEQAEQPAARSADSDIVVTGSRIRRPNLESTVPITSVSPSELSQRGEVSLGDALNDLPALRSTFSQANSTTSIGTAGLSLLDLRGLGTVRTLVLVNGRRHVTATPGGTQVDVNTIPVDLLERVDVVTGGNSAVYGSDAVAGVVNFILRRDFTGIRMRAQAGISQYGDRENVFGSVVAGRNFADGRLNITAHAEYSNAKEVFYSDRPYLGAYTGPSGFYTTQISNAPNRNFDGIPNTGFWDNQNGSIPGIMFGNISTGGYVSTVCPAATGTNAAQVAAACTGQLTPTGGRIARNYAFLPDGTLAPDIPFFDNRPIGGGVFGGLSATGLEDAMLLPGLERIVGNIFINGDISPAFQPFLEGKFVRVNATQQSTQPTFTSGRLTATFSINNPFLTTQARNQLLTINPTGTTFSMLRFNNDFGTRAEDHQRDTYRIVGGVRGDLSSTGNLRYEFALNYGKTKTYYETGGNVIVNNFNNAANAVADSVSGQTVCFINSSQDLIPVGQPGAGTINTANNDPRCVPINLFGRGAPSRAALDYVLFTSSRRQEATQLNAVGFISGDTEGLFELPGGPIGFALGGEYRREKARSELDPFTASGATFLNASAPFLPPKQVLKEGFAELRLPLVKDIPLLRELTVEGAFRRSNYNTFGNVDAYNAGLLWSPVRGIRGRIGYGRSVRAPNLGDLFATAAETFNNALTDPCDQPGFTNTTNNITANPARAANCAAAGVPTTITYLDTNGQTVTVGWHNVPGSGVSGINRGNPDLRPETGDSVTVGVIIEPPFLPGFALTIDYYDIEVNSVIGSLGSQAIINRCYDDPTGINNEFCSAVFRRTSTDPLQNRTFAGQTTRRLQNRLQDTLPNVGPSFINQPFNFAALVRSGVDFDASYRRRVFGNKQLSLRGIVSYLGKSENFSFQTQPNRSDKIDETLGDPKWAASWNAGLDFGVIDFSYSGTYVGRQSILAWETQFTHQGRGPTNPDARPFRWYPAGVTHSGRVNFQINNRFRYYMGVDNITNERPPFDLTGLEAGSPYGPTGRYFYAGAGLNF